MGSNSSPSEFYQLDCLLGCEELVEFGGEDLCSSVVEQVLGLCFDGDPNLVAGDAWSGGVVQEEENSSGTTARPGRDRARTLVSERHRGRMKEKLYELRSVVPNITKLIETNRTQFILVMTGFSSSYSSCVCFRITDGQGIHYRRRHHVRERFAEAKTLTEEIARLESLAEAAYCSHLHHREPETLGAMDPLPKRVMLEFSGCGLGDKRFHIRLVALEKLTFLHLESSSLSTCSEKHEVTPTMKVDGSAGEIHSSVLKSWVMTVLMDEGFGFHVEARKPQVLFIKIQSSLILLVLYLLTVA
ncbi:unnamed protein product [Spirodela intermedia]|uniref:Uncharacterized protein n=1 Tax=Spirodela intermedia TaxID=51605 RepID=A0A7I8L621_SPIIN|nr:unnamed protein product [Spirodela intermedia]